MDRFFTSEFRKWVLTIFSEYYKKTIFDIPKIEQREFGVGFEKKIDSRHLSFDSEQQLKNYLINNTPFFISHSTAYYSFPATTPIDKKQWLGADLVFDLDIHSDTKYGVYTKLEQVKQDSIRLSEEFLQDDFGFSKQEIIYVFSGNRGYHIHVRNKAVFDLKSKERREIVDYIRGVGLNYKNFFYKDEIGRIIGPNQDSTGYKGRILKKTLELLDEKPGKFYRRFSKDDEAKDKFIEGIKNGNWSRIPFNRDKLYKNLNI